MKSMRKLYLAETAELANGEGRNENSKWGLAAGSGAQSTMINLIGTSFFPKYKTVRPILFIVDDHLKRIPAGHYRLPQSLHHSKI
jgi:hypothetical protein